VHLGRCGREQGTLACGSGRACMQARQSDLGGAGGGLGGRGCTFRAGGAGARVDEQKGQTVQAAMIMAALACASVRSSAQRLLAATGCRAFRRHIRAALGATLPVRGAGLEAGAMEVGWVVGTCKLWKQPSDGCC